MGQNQSKPHRGSTSSTSSTTPFRPTANPTEDALLEKNYAAYYSSDTYNSISAAAATLTPAHPTRDPTVAQFQDQPVPPTGITRPAPRQNLLRVSELIDPLELASRSAKHAADVHDPKRSGLSPDKSPSKGHHLTEADKDKRLPGLVQSPSGNIFGVKEYATHPNRPLAIRERQEGIKAALARAQQQAEQEESVRSVMQNGCPLKEKGMRQGSVETTGTALSKGGERTKERKGSAGSTGSEKTVDSGVSFASSEGRNVSVGEWEKQRIKEGRREWEERQAKKDDGKKKFLCF
ncbi:MAG: hypothetical protein LQ340_004447 [Diploschistes diacapsis]|nr:MAG: hypothetical protein LQ340_004447 [Diploschistes diacapsis]